jgi:hypothetical protein
MDQRLMLALFYFVYFIILKTHKKLVLIIVVISVAQFTFHVDVFCFLFSLVRLNRKQQQN